MRNLSLWKVVTGAFLTLALAVVLGTWWADREKQPTTRACAGMTLVVNDSTEAQCAKLVSDRHELQALKTAAKGMGGSLVAGTKLVVKRDTVVRVDTAVVTTHDSAGTRTGVLDEVKDGYHVQIQAVAPPTGNLRIGYTVTSPERTIEVGFVKRKDGYYAVASGKGVKTSEAFFTPEKPRLLSLHIGGVLKGAPDDNALGATVRGDVYGALQAQRGRTAVQLRGGHDGSPYVGLAVQRQVW